MRICLNMIVKNEIDNLERCLTSLAPQIQCWVVCDTGSTDGTPEFVDSFFRARGLPGELHRIPFETFEQARNAALDRARRSAQVFDYLLLVDADMELMVEEPDAFRHLSADLYRMQQRSGLTYWNARLLRRGAEARYRGVTHEYLDLPSGRTESLQGAHFIDHASGANRPGKFERDAALLRAALATEQDPGLIARYTFYLANSLRDGGQPQAALDAYLRRARQGFWEQEVYLSLLCAARLRETLGHPAEAVLAAYAEAAAACPMRAEAQHGAARYCRNAGRHAQGADVARPALALPPPHDALFVEDWIYQYGLRDEFAVNAYWAGHYRESLEACLALLAQDALPEGYRARIAANARFACDRLAEGAGPPGAPAPEAPRRSTWAPARAQAGTELMVDGLHARLGRSLDRIQLRVNLFDEAALDARPLVVWIHHDIDQAAVQWLREARLVARVAHFVFVSDWQRQRFLAAFGLDPARCTVLRNATEVAPINRAWLGRRPLTLAYTSTPYRGLSVLLDAWDRLRPDGAELHLWSSHRLYGPAFDDAPYRDLFDRARALPNVHDHGIVPNAELRAALRGIDLLAYPCTFAETSCLAVIEALAAGCRVVCPDLGALPETVGRFGRLYPYEADPAAHAEAFARVLAEELADPWGGRRVTAEEQQDFARTTYGWPGRAAQWQAFVQGLAAPPPSRPAIKQVAAKRGTFLVTERDHISENIAQSGDWEPHLYAFAEMVLGPESNVVDLGANLGYHTVGLARLVPRGEVFAFEPLTHCFAQLQMNVVANGLGNVRAFKMAATDTTGATIEMEAIDAGPAGGFVNIGRTAIGRGGDAAFTVRLDDLVLPPIAFVKIDVQGAEVEALTGMRALIARDRPVLFVEIEDLYLRNRGTDSKRLIEMLLALDYSLVRIRTDWPTDHLAIPNERPDLIARVTAQTAYATDLIAGSAVELVFENDYFYAGVTVTP
ncbi:FkbM family methyltransferase [Methylobacterium oryzisoli]|uniref:FkbM family methyltransferase n=1 Tax=Methylobacterium oryzisoli TaxID=3385502 RepID=UPI003891F6FD